VPSLPPKLATRTARTWRERARRSVVAIAWLYPFALSALIAAMALVGERHWLSAALLYVPRVVYGAPLPFLVVALYWVNRRRAPWSQLIAAFLWLFPLMGLVLPWPRSATAAPTVRLLSFNVDSGHAGEEVVLDAISAQRPDIAVLVEAPNGPSRLPEMFPARFRYTHRFSQFLFGSRFPIKHADSLPRVDYGGHSRTARAMRYELDTPEGPLVVYAVHPISPRGVFGVYRFRGVFQRLKQATVVSPLLDEESDMLGNAGLRAAEIEAALRAARAERLPVIVAGDTNLPGLSPTLRRAFAGFEDGFEQVSSGFGYTFPAKRPFLRLDRIFAGPGLRFTSFQVGCRGASDHLCVWADLTRR